MVELLRTQTVLDGRRETIDAMHFYQTREKGEDGNPTIVSITKELFRELGEPEEITVTIKPGDMLNPEPDYCEIDVTHESHGVMKCSLELPCPIHDKEHHHGEQTDPDS